MSLHTSWNCAERDSQSAVQYANLGTIGSQVCPTPILRRGRAGANVDAKEFRLELCAGELFGALAALTVAQKRGSTVSVFFENGELQFVRGVTCVRVPARGSWPARASVGTRFIRDLLRRRKVVPDCVVLIGTASHLRFTAESFPFSWSSAPIPCSWLPAA